MTHLGIEKTYLLGLSLGGMIAVDFTLDHPDMVDALILVGAPVSGFPIELIYRLQKVLETANVKLSSVGSLVMGKSGQRMVAAMIEGGSSAEALADLARGTLRRKLPQLQQALNGQIEAHHRVLLVRIFAHMSFLEDSIQHLQLEIDQRLSPFAEAMQLRLAHPWRSGDYCRGDSGGNRL